MKTGKFLRLKTYQNVRIGYGTINCKELKTIYLSFKSWIKPTIEDDYDVLISRTRKKIKTHLFNSISNLFEKETIVDINIKTNRIKLNKKTFMDVEITLYTKEFFDLKDEDIKETIKELIYNVIDIGFNNKKFYNFCQNKK